MTVNDNVMVPLAAAAQLTRLTYATVYGAGLRGHMRLRRMGGRLWVPLADIEAYAAKVGRPIKRVD